MATPGAAHTPTPTHPHPAATATLGVQSIIRSHQLPKRKRGYEIQHDAMLLTIFSASNYGGVCGNRGGALAPDDRRRGGSDGRAEAGLVMWI